MNIGIHINIKYINIILYINIHNFFLSSSSFSMRENQEQKGDALANNSDEFTSVKALILSECFLNLWMRVRHPRHLLTPSHISRG